MTDDLWLCREPGPGGLKPCCFVFPEDVVRDCPPWATPEHEHLHVWWAQEGRTLWVYDENPMQAYPDLRVHADLTDDAAVTVEEVAALFALLDLRTQNR